MASAQDPNQQNYVNPSLARIVGNNIDAPKTGRVTVAYTPNYVTRTALNTSTGQTESDTTLVIH